jgi:hypothetical protein
MPHPLVTQFRFTRSEWVRGLKAGSADAARRFGPINPIAWMIGHLAWQEQLYWLERAQGLTPVPEAKEFGYGKPLAVRPLGEAWAWWLHRTTYHYWLHLGESQAVRQMLGHTKLPDFVGSFGKNQYRPEPGATAS